MSQHRPAPTDAAHRELCLRCLRPRRACWCPHLRPVESATRACILQHVRERKTAIGTARMAHLSLPNSELHLGVSFREHPRVRALAAEEGTALLFPGEGAIDPAALRGRPPKTVIVVDGTWQQARKLLKENPFLLALPRIGLSPERPSNYRIRTEPSRECVSTIEAAVLLLGALEGAPERFTPILEAFDRMVDLQIAERDRRTGPPRRLRRKGQKPPRTDTTMATLRARPGDVVAVYAESSGWPASAGPQRECELLQLVALRPSTGERFEAVVAPRRPLEAERSPAARAPRGAVPGGRAARRGARALRGLPAAGRPALRLGALRHPPPARRGGAAARLRRPEAGVRAIARTTAGRRRAGGAAAGAGGAAARLGRGAGGAEAGVPAGGAPEDGRLTDGYGGCRVAGMGRSRGPRTSTVVLAKIEGSALPVAGERHDGTEVGQRMGRSYGSGFDHFRRSPASPSLSTLPAM